VILGIVAVHLFNLNEHGVEIVGNIDSGLPSFGLPDVEAHRYLDIAPAAIGVMLVGFAESLGAAKTYATKFRYEIDANRELLGLGAANVASGLSSGMVVNGSLSKTAVNSSAGAKSQLSGLVVAVLTVITLLFLTGLFEELPEAILAAVVVAALIELVDIAALRRLWRLHSSGLDRIYGIAARTDFLAAIAALIGVLVFDTLPGLFIGIALSLLLLLYRASRPHIAHLGRVRGTDQYVDLKRQPQNETDPGIVVLRVEGALFFANADAVRKEIRDYAAAPGTRAIVLDGETVPSVDVTAAAMLAELTEDLRADGVQLVLARDIGQVRDLLEKAEADQPIPAYPTVQAAVEAVRKSVRSD
jgi:anti-anti-sigma factor